MWERLGTRYQCPYKWVVPDEAETRRCVHFPSAIRFPELELHHSLCSCNLPSCWCHLKWRNVLPRLKWEQQFLDTLKQVASLQTPPEVIGRLSERETMECSTPAWTNYKAEEGKGNEGAKKGAWVWGSLTAVLAKSRLSAKRMFTVLKSGFKKQVAGMNLHYSPLK